MLQNNAFLRRLELIWVISRLKISGISRMSKKCVFGKKLSNCEEELPEKPVGRLLVNCQPTDYRQLTDSFPEKKICCENR